MAAAQVRLRGQLEAEASCRLPPSVPLSPRVGPVAPSPRLSRVGGERGAGGDLGDIQDKVSSSTFHVLSAGRIALRPGSLHPESWWHPRARFNLGCTDWAA